MTPTYNYNRLVSTKLAALILIIGFWIVLGFDGRLHWDEPQYLYTGAFFSIQEIVADHFQASGIDGFTVSRIAHVALVKLLAEIFGVGGHLVLLVMIFYEVLLTICLYVTYLILRDLGVSAVGAGFATLIVGFSPVGLYLAYKTLPDVPALMWSSLAVLAAIRSVQRRGWFWIPVGAVAISAAALTKYILVWTFAAFALTVLIPGHPSMPWKKSLPIFLVMGTGSILVFALVLIAAGLPLADFLAFLSVARNTSDPLVAKIFHILVALGILLTVLPIAAFHHDKKLTRFLLVWFAMATLPFLIVVPRLEVRYLAPGLIPLAGLTFLALDVLRSRLPAALGRPRSEVLLAGLLVFTVALSSRTVQGLTEHEVEMYSMHRLLKRLDAVLGPGAYAVVTPWEYSTFLYLRLVYPNRAVYDGFDPRLVGEPDWMAAQEKFFDGYLLRNMDQVRAISDPLVYIGFPEAMPIANLRDWTDWTPDPIRQAVLRKLDSLGALKHISLSWMWHAPELSLSPMAQVGNYTAYNVEVREADRAASAGPSWAAVSCRHAEDAPCIDKMGRPNLAHGRDEKLSRSARHGLS